MTTMISVQRELIKSESRTPSTRLPYTLVAMIRASKTVFTLFEMSDALPSRVQQAATSACLRCLATNVLLKTFYPDTLTNLFTILPSVILS